jgi:4-amino-4-deoxy-L-arabinose transferase-like glycosyltransferase
MSRREWLFVAAIFVAAAIVGGVYVLTLDNESPLVRGDTVEYNQIAVNLVQGEGYAYFDPPQPTAFRPPGYPVFLAAVYKVFGVSLLAARFAQAFLRAGTCVLIFLTARVLFGTRAAGVAAVASVFYPFFLYYHVGPVAAEGLYTFLLVLLLFLLQLGLRRRGSALWFLSGTVLGAAFLTAPRIFLFPVFLVMLMPMALSSRKRAAVCTVLLVLGCGLVMLPWTVRNYIVFDRVVLVTTHGGYDLLAGVNPDYRVWRERDERSEVFQEHARQVRGVLEEDLSSVTGMSLRPREDAVDTEGYRVALGVLIDQPGEILGNIPFKLSEFWKILPVRDGPHDTFLYRLLWIMTMDLLTVLGAVGVFLTIGQWRYTLPLVLCVLSASLVHLVFTAQHRYQTAVMPFVIMFAGVTVDWAIRRAEGYVRGARQDAALVPGGTR